LAADGGHKIATKILVVARKVVEELIDNEGYYTDKNGYVWNVTENQMNDDRSCTDGGGNYTDDGQTMTGD
jgi:hypothetical protein